MKKLYLFFSIIALIMGIFIVTNRIINIPIELQLAISIFLLLLEIFVVILIISKNKHS